MSESSFVFLLREPNSEFEIMYNQQQGQVVVAEAQIFVKGDHIEGGCLFFIDNLYDMDKLISYLSEIRGKMDRHYAACAGIMPSGEVLGVSDSIGAKVPTSPYCVSCCKSLACESLTERQNLLCFDCERKSLIDKVNKPLTESEKRFYKFCEQDKYGECQAIGCDNLREPMSYFCIDHSDGNYVGPLKLEIEAEKNELKRCIRKACGNYATAGSDYCSGHKKFV